jgi:predicted NodU family carbamoyl transferase
MAAEGYDFSLSGLKTAVIRELRRLEAAGIEPDLADVAASFQEAIVDVQVLKTLRAAGAEGIDTVVLAGGVAANRRLRERMAAECEANGQRLLVPSIPLCTDNGAMVAAAGATCWPPATTPTSTSPSTRTCRWPDEAPPALAARAHRGARDDRGRLAQWDAGRGRGAPHVRALHDRDHGRRRAADRRRRPPLGGRGGLPRDGC